jgi:hypothetical protein
MTFALDPSTEQGLSVLGYLVDLHKQGAPIRFGLILAPGATAGRGTAGSSAGAPRLPPLLHGSATRLAALESAYAHPAWQAAARVGELEVRAAAAVAGGSAAWGGEGGNAGVGGAPALSQEDAEEEALGLLLTKLFLFCRSKLGAAAAMRFLELTREVRGSPYRRGGRGIASTGVWEPALRFLELTGRRAALYTGGGMEGGGGCGELIGCRAA